MAAVNSEISGIFNVLVTAWQHVNAAMQKLSANAAVVPTDLTSVLRVMEQSDDEFARFELTPVVFRLPERGGRSSTNLFVVVRGRIAFSRLEFRESRSLCIRGFSTEVAYFRHKGNTLIHVFGAHYDFAADEVGHPAFHAQMKSFAEFSAEIASSYRIHDPVHDYVRGILETVRIPTAHLDVFSVFLQLCADHLLYSGSDAQEREAFNALLKKSAFCRGAASEIPRLINDEAAHCYRGRHWYPSIA